MVEGKLVAEASLSNEMGVVEVSLNFALQLCQVMMNRIEIGKTV